MGAGKVPSAGEAEDSKAEHAGSDDHDQGLAEGIRQ
jgi:hypothetical protein